jgi:hypothetical protein
MNPEFFRVAARVRSSQGLVKALLCTKRADEDLALDWRAYAGPQK